MDLSVSFCCMYAARALFKWWLWQSKHIKHGMEKSSRVVVHQKLINFCFVWRRIAHYAETEMSKCDSRLLLSAQETSESFNEWHTLQTVSRVVYALHCEIFGSILAPPETINSVNCRLKFIFLLLFCNDEHLVNLVYQVHELATYAFNSTDFVLSLLLLLWPRGNFANAINMEGVSHRYSHEYIRRHVAVPTHNRFVN